MKQAHNSSCISEVRSNIILSIDIAFLVTFPLLNPNLSSPSTSSTLFSIIFLSMLATISAICVARLTVRWSLHFAASGFYNAITLTSVKSLGHSPVSCKLLISCVTIFRPSSPYSFSRSPDTSSFTVAISSLISLTASSISLRKYKDLSRLHPLPLHTSTLADGCHFEENTLTVKEAKKATLF